MNKLMKHETSKGHEMQASYRGGKPLIVTRQAAKTRHPGKGAFDDPVTPPPEVICCL